MGYYDFDDYDEWEDCEQEWMDAAEYFISMRGCDGEPWIDACDGRATAADERIAETLDAMYVEWVDDLDEDPAYFDRLRAEIRSLKDRRAARRRSYRRTSAPVTDLKLIPEALIAY